MDQFLLKLKTPIAKLWENNKIFLICFGLLILVIKFQDVIFDFLVKSSKKLVEDSAKKDQELKQEQDQANNQANQLVQEAQDLGNNRPAVDENWYKNEKK